MYICNRSASYFIFMRRDIFQAIADPTRRAILVLIAVQAMTPQKPDSALAIAEKVPRSRNLSVIELPAQ
jgi:hypothetical protein